MAEKEKKTRPGGRNKPMPGIGYTIDANAGRDRTLPGIGHTIDPSGFRERVVPGIGFRPDIQVRQREQPPLKRSRYGMPGTTAPKLGASPGKGGHRATGLVTGSRNVLDVFVSPDSPGALAAGITLRRRR